MITHSTSSGALGASQYVGTSGYWRFGKEPATFLFLWNVIAQSADQKISMVDWKLIVDDVEVDNANITLDEIDFRFWYVTDLSNNTGLYWGTYDTISITTPQVLKHNAVLARGTITLNHKELYWASDSFKPRIHKLVCSNGLDTGDAGNYPSEYPELYRDFSSVALMPSDEYRKCNVSVEPVRVGEETIIRIFNNGNASYTYFTLNYSIGDISYGSIVSEFTGNLYHWTIPKEVYREFQNKDGQARIHLLMMTDDGFENYHFDFFFYTNPNDCRATINYTITDTNPTTIALTGDSSKIVKYHSDVKWTVSAVGAYDIPIWLVAAATPDQIVYGNLSLASASGTFDYLTSKEIRFLANDYRDIDTWITADYPWVEYVALTNTTETKNPTPEGTVDINIKGNYFNGSFGAQNNSLTVQYRYKKLSADNFSNWINITPKITGNTYTATTTLTGMDYTEAYQLETQVIDKLTTTSSGVKTIKAKTVFDWSKEDFNFNVPVNVDGDTTLNGAVEINGDVNIVGNVSAGNIPAKLYSGTWTPTCNACSSPDTAYGTYMRIDDVCVINFYIGGTFTSTQTYLSFDGLPFTPSDEIRWQSGGGNLSGGTLQANSPFVCWNIESTDTDTIKKIYGRTCNVTINTSAGTRNSGYAGSKTSDTFHASGTICYKIAEGV